MNNIAQQLQETLKAEEAKISDSKGLQEFEQLFHTMQQQGYVKKPNYTLPMVDTIGKNYYNSIRRRP